MMLLHLLSTFFIIGLATKLERGEEITISVKDGGCHHLLINYEEPVDMKNQFWCVQANFLEPVNKTPKIDFLLRLVTLPNQ